ncbi:unnamed protein product [Peniophora sp. CBMAI 1063]|nr:unnamed protein product [Peniophora sp. CBMAI 1063]
MLGYGYVKFGDAHSVDNALEVDRTTIGGRMVYVRALHVRLDTVVVKNLPHGADDSLLRSTFGKFGEISDVGVRTVHHRQDSQLIGFVTFSSLESADAARKLSGTKINGKPITVRFSMPQARIISHAMKGEPASTSVYVSDLPPQVTDDWLRAEFEQCGEIEVVHVQRPRLPDGSPGVGTTLGYAYIEFSTADAVDKALALGSRLTIAGHAIRIRRGTPFVATREPTLRMGPDPDDTTVWVAGLTHGVRHSALRAAFERFGEIISAFVVVDRESRRSRGFGFVIFASRDSASAAVKYDRQINIQGFMVRIERPKPRLQSKDGSSSTQSD